MSDKIINSNLLSFKLRSCSDKFLSKSIYSIMFPCGDTLLAEFLLMR